MAEPIPVYTPQGDIRAQLQRKLANAPVQHADALLAAYELLQEAQDRGVLDTMRGAIGAGGELIGKISEYTNTPEGVRALYNLLATVRLFGELDPKILDSMVQTLARANRRDHQEDVSAPSLLQTLRRLTGPDSRRAVAKIVEFTESFGSILAESPNAPARKRRFASGAAVPVVFSAVAVMALSFWIGRRSSSK